MRKIVNATYMTLDGDITNMQDWHFQYFGDDAIKTAQDQLYAADALIMGHETYKGFFPAWSAQDGDNDFATKMNSYKKYVVSSQLKDPEWKNSEVINGDVVAEVKKIKEQPGQDILQYGFGSVTRLLLENDLLDELVFWVHPILSGKAQQEHLLYRDMPQTKFELISAEPHSTGTLILTYRPLKAEATDQTAG